MRSIEESDLVLLDRQAAIWAQREERDMLLRQHPHPLPLTRALSATRLHDTKLRALVEQDPRNAKRVENAHPLNSPTREQKPKDSTASAVSPTSDQKQSTKTAQLLKEYVASADDEDNKSKASASGVRTNATREPGIRKGPRAPFCILSHSPACPPASRLELHLRLVH